MTLKVDGTTQPAESLVGDLDFITITMPTVNYSAEGTDQTDAEFSVNGDPGLDVDGIPNDHSAKLTDLVVEVISQKAQPVIVALASVKIMNVVVEHTGIFTIAQLKIDIEDVLTRFKSSEAATKFQFELVTITATVSSTIA